MCVLGGTIYRQAAPAWCNCDSCASHMVHICHSCTSHRCMCMADRVCALVAQCTLCTGRLHPRGAYLSCHVLSLVHGRECVPSGAQSTGRLCPRGAYWCCMRFLHGTSLCCRHFHRCMADRVCALVSQSTGRLRLRGMYQSVL